MLCKRRILALSANSAAMFADKFTAVENRHPSGRESHSQDLTGQLIRH